MNKHEYAEEVCRYVNKNGYETEIIDSSRNNGAFVGVLVKAGKAGNVSPIFNINGQESVSPADFADQILSTLPSDINVEAVTDIIQDKDEVMNRSHYILVNSEMNAARESLFRRPINRTLELQYKIDIEDVMPGARVPIEKKHLAMLGLDAEEFCKKALDNTMEKYPAKFLNINEVLPMSIGEDIPMYVLTNTIKQYGAGAILYSGMKKKLEDAVGDFVVLPSSVHETIIIPRSLGEIDGLTHLIREVNETTVRPEEVLSDVPYELISDGALFEV